MTNESIISMNKELSAATTDLQKSEIVKKYFDADKDAMKVEKKKVVDAYNKNFDDAIVAIEKSIPATLKSFVKIDKENRTLSIKANKGGASGSKAVYKTYTVSGKDLKEPVTLKNGQAKTWAEENGIEVGAASAIAKIKSAGYTVVAA